MIYLVSVLSVIYFYDMLLIVAFSGLEESVGGAVYKEEATYRGRGNYSITRSPAPRMMKMSAPRSTSMSSPPPPQPQANISNSTISTAAHVVVNPPSHLPKPVQPALHPAQTTVATNSSSSDVLDVTKIPALLDKQYERYDRDNAIRPAIINLGPRWKKESAKGLLAARQTSWLTSGDEQTASRNAAFDLLDALTRSGGLVIEQGCSFHVIVAGVHRFDQSLMQTIIQKNVNPIVSVERSYLLMASTLQGVSVSELVTEQNDQQRERIAQDHAQLLAIKN